MAFLLIQDLIILKKLEKINLYSDFYKNEVSKEYGKKKWIVWKQIIILWIIIVIKMMKILICSIRKSNILFF